MKNTKFSLRKSAFGLVSVAIAVLGVSTASSSVSASADEVSNSSTSVSSSSETLVIPHGFVSTLDESLPEFTAKVTSLGSDGTSIVDGDQTKVITEKVDTQISYNVPDTVTVTDAHDTIYTEDNTSDNATPVLKQEGQDGVSTKDVLSYQINESDTNPTISDVTYSEPTVVTEKKDTIYTVGTKPTVETTETNYATKYKSDDTLELGKETIIQDGKVGKVVKTTTYKVDSKTGERTSSSTNSEIKSIDKIVAKGTKPTEEKTTLQSKVKYIFDDSKPSSYSDTTQGSDGYSVVKTTYQVNEDTGEVTVLNKETSTVEPSDTVITKGVSKSLNYYDIDFEVKEVEDASLPKGTTKVSVEGVKGQGLTTTTYSGNSDTGEVTSSSSDSIIKEPITKIVLVGTGEVVKQGEITKQDETAKQNESAKQGTAKQDTVKQEETKQEETKKDETTKQDTAKQEETKQEGIKKDETAKQEETTKRDTAKQEETTKRDTAKQEETTKQDTAKQDTTKRDTAKQDTTKQDSSLKTAQGIQNVGSTASGNNDKELPKMSSSNDFVFLSLIGVMLTSLGTFLRKLKNN